MRQIFYLFYFKIDELSNLNLVITTYSKERHLHIDCLLLVVFVGLFFESSFNRKILHAFKWRGKIKLIFKQSVIPFKRKSGSKRLQGFNWRKSIIEAMLLL